MTRSAQRLSRPVVVASLAMAAAVFLASPAYAFLGVGDTSDALLADIIANGAKQLTTLSDTLTTVRKSYDEARKLTGYAEDAYALAASFQQFSMQRFGERLQSDMDTAYPDAAYYRDGMTYGRWAQGDRLVPLLRYCLNGTLSKDPTGHIVFSSQRLCTDLRQELSTSDLLVMLGQTFGTVPAQAANSAGGVQASVVDAEVAAQLAAQTSEWNRAQRVKQEVEALEADCAQTSDSSGPSTACEAAAQRAQMESLAEQTETNRLLAEETRLLALELSQRNSELKREMTETVARRTALTTNGQALRADEVKVVAGASDL